MYKIFFLYCTFLLTFSSVHGSENIDIKSSQSTVGLSETFQVDIVLNASEVSPDSVRIELPWIESFDIFSRGQSENYSNINGEIQRTMLYSLVLSPLSKWDFTLWPVLVSTNTEEIVDDESLNISVLENAIIPEERSEEKLWSSSEEGISSEKTIRWLRSPLESWLWVFISIIWFIVAFYFLLKYVLGKYEEKNHTITYEKHETDVYDTYKQYFHHLSLQVGEISSEDFFRRYNTGLRKVLSISGYSFAESATLEDLKKYKELQDNSVLALLKKSYSYEYASKKISQQTQKKYIEDILKVLG